MPRDKNYRMGTDKGIHIIREVEPGVDWVEFYNMAIVFWYTRSFDNIYGTDGVIPLSFARLLLIAVTHRSGCRSGAGESRPDRHNKLYYFYK